MKSEDPVPPRDEGTPLDGQTLALRLWVALARAHNAVLAHAQDDVSRHDLTLAEFGVLEVLFHRGPLLLGEVQRRILVSSGGITYLVDRLERRGLVERRACPGDRRARLAALTPQGEAFIARIFPEHAARVKAALAGIDKKDKRQALKLLRDIARTASGEEGGG